MGEVLRVGLLGCGNVGAAVVRMLHDHAADIERRAGARIELRAVAVRYPSRPRGLPVEQALFTADAMAVARDPGLDVVVEAIGGIEPARSLLLAAMASGKSVVTANKALLSTCGGEVFDAAVAAGVDVLYEASVGGGIPVIRPIREHLAGDRILRFAGILNGTTNYILTRMAEEGSSFADALAEAQRLGFAEADPTADVEGFDAAAKAAILATIAFDVRVTAEQVHREGIAGISASDMAVAARLGYVVKLLAIGQTAAGGDGGVSVRVHPAMLPTDHPLAAVRHSFNAVLIEGERVGPLMLYGLGAGGDPTAVSVVGDLVDLARTRARPGSITTAGHAAHAGAPAGARLRPIEDLESQYCLVLEVADRPGVLAAVSTSFAEHAVSIRQVWQEGRGDEAQLVLVTHRASERSLRATVTSLRGLDAVKAVGSVIRVLADDA